MLVKSHGFILSAGATAKVMGFGSTDALRFARAAGRLPIQMFLVEGRRGWFASAEDVATWLDKTTVASRKNSPKKAKNTKQKATAD
ncbi:hypothetical protein [Dyella telluris]|uniref:DNA-binding protein n=1 Tax=Dyella telluris TaxID=2763498 RepID=A0A7G8Q9L3_9GAMM|nr:hypothetical protein [Dyella telluris]QNK03471.1 hypothetical protein H8F01_10340 [Dyella telluris]